MSISSPQTVAEGSPADNIITLSAPSAVPVTVTVTPAGNGANPTVPADLGPQEYSTDGGTTFIPVPGRRHHDTAKVTSVIVRTPTVNDTTGEPAETFWRDLERAKQWCDHCHTKRDQHHPSQRSGDRLYRQWHHRA
ncbi:MAG: hypothetical protein IPI14_11905 [Polaromonas sp.]|nr:hypothetical protein [Polaromonas sp.]